ncbi:MAG TPA: carboxypeptidase-like regulatory domain-containing protein [Terriglobales bacterium]|nr:carboxypeptidase-like regulatory domain-containing protein [Terriglobales bacterium]
MKLQRIYLIIFVVIAMGASLIAQDASTPSDNGIVTGTVTDTNGDTLAGATVALRTPDNIELRSIPSQDNGSFQFGQMPPGTYSIAITANGFSSWNSSDFSLAPGQYFILTGSQLRIATATTSVNVSDSDIEVATEQVQIEETQRAFGIIPNFYVVYEPSPAPLTTKLKFHLAMKTSSDPVTILGIATLAGINQAGDTPDYSQGWNAYGKRVGAVAANGLSDIMIGGAILPSLLHQDPRYYYQGTGSAKSRTLHALSSPFLCRGDNGKLQPNYSSLGGDIGSAALSNLYYPASNRGTGLVLSNFFLTTGERMLNSVLQEFVIGKITKSKTKN